jgi:hypothetical protein
MTYVYVDLAISRVFFGSLFPICSQFVPSLPDCTPSLCGGAALSVAGHRNDIDGEPGKSIKMRRATPRRRIHIGNVKEK